jgi:hypothetical protein
MIVTLPIERSTNEDAPAIRALRQFVRWCAAQLLHGAARQFDVAAGAPIAFQLGDGNATQAGTKSLVARQHSIAE